MPQIALITIITNNLPAMTRFYRDVLGFPVQQDLGQYVEFESEGVRFSLCSREVMHTATGDASFTAPRRGQSFELAFPVSSPDAVEQTYEQIVASGATPIKAPAEMPWGQKTAFFADPDGNIHELFADLPAE